MKKKISISQVLLWILTAGLLVSLAFNLIQYNHANPSSPILRGTYSTNAMSGNGEYLAFDAEEHFCLYTQNEGLLEEGNYKQYGENLYRLESTSGNHSSILLTDDGVYYSYADGSLELFSRFNDTPIFIGDWSKDWSGWPQGSYEFQKDKAE